MTDQAFYHGLPLPNFALTFDDPDEVDAAIVAWRLIVSSMAEAETLTPVNGRLIENLVLLYALYERAAKEVAANGAVLRPKKGNSRAIARVSPHFSAMVKLSADALALESALGLTPRTRGKVTKPARLRPRKSTPADEFLSKGAKVVPFGRPKGD
jgi:P27 family predicted phage terminase small subunit